jgi:hypothetical protein
MLLNLEQLNLISLASGSAACIAFLIAGILLLSRRTLRIHSQLQKQEEFIGTLQMNLKTQQEQLNSIKKSISKSNINQKKLDQLNHLAERLSTAEESASRHDKFIKTLLRELS